MEHHVAISAEHSTELLLQHVLRLTVLVSQMCGKSGEPNPLEEMTWLTNKFLRQEPPWVIKMTGIQEKKIDGKKWYSDPVYSHFGGYKMCLCVYANGIAEGKGTHVSVGAFLMQGDNDENLKWPFKGSIKVSLLNQLEDGQHHIKELWSPGSNIPERYSRRVTAGEIAVAGWGQHEFISQQDLSYKGDKNCQYLKDDTLFFRVDCIEPKLD